MTTPMQPAATMRPPAILVPLDGSRHATVALPVARGLADQLGAVLQLIHIAEPRLTPEELLTRVGLTPEQLFGSVLDQQAGSPAEAIVRLARARPCSYIVMCTRTGMEKPRGQLGSVAEEVLRTAPCPLVLVQPERGLHPWALRSVLLPHDGTPATAVLLRPALDLTSRVGATLSVLHVAAIGRPRPTEPGALTVPRYIDQPHHEWTGWQQEFLQRVRALGQSPAALPLSLHVAQGEPGAEIVRFAKAHAADLIVLAWHGSLEETHAATLKAVIHEAPCPVLILRADAASLSEERAGATAR